MYLVTNKFGYVLFLTVTYIQFYVFYLQSSTDMTTHSLLMKRSSVPLQRSRCWETSNSLGNLANLTLSTNLSFISASKQYVFQHITVNLICFPKLCDSKIKLLFYSILAVKCCRRNSVVVLINSSFFLSFWIRRRESNSRIWVKIWNASVR